jgi:hypothetical protein
VTLPSLRDLPARLLGRFAIRDEILLAATTWIESPACP